MNIAQRALCALAIALAATACTQKQAAGAAGKNDSIATVDGRSISRNTYNQYVKGVAGKPPEDLSEKDRAELLDNLVRGEVVAGEAERSGIAAQDETRAVMDLERLQILQQASSQAYLKDRQPSDQELRAEYDLQVAQLPKMQYRASHILVPTEDAAKDVIAKLAKGASFEQLAKTLSTDTGSKDKGGDLDWFAPQNMTPAFAEAVQKLKKGETTAAPVKTQFGWHVIRLTDTRENAPPPFDSVKDRLVQIVQGKKFKAYVDGLVAKAKVTKTP